MVALHIYNQLNHIGSPLTSRHQNISSHCISRHHIRSWLFSASSHFSSPHHSASIYGTSPQSKSRHHSRPTKPTSRQHYAPHHLTPLHTSASFQFIQFLGTNSPQCSPGLGITTVHNVPRNQCTSSKPKARHQYNPSNSTTIHSSASHQFRA